MGFELSSKDYVEYLNEFYTLLQENKEYITNLDLATGDGDHWLNMNTGFGELLKKEDELKEMDLQTCFKNISITLMSKIGGSSGVLYGGAYMAAAKQLNDVEAIDRNVLYNILNAMLEDIMKRGKSEPGSKTMVDALYPAVERLKEAIEEDLDDEKLLKEVAKAAKEGAESTKDMKAIRGRASYQSDKGLGHLDPGAVTMAYQIETLCNYIIKTL